MMEQFETTERQNTDNKIRLSVIVVVFAVTSGTSFCVYNTANVNNLKPIVVDYLNHTGAGVSVNKDPDTVWSIVVAAFTIGSGFGNICSAFLAEKLGRKFTLILSAMLNICGGLMCIFYLRIFQLSIGGRFVMGVSIGLGLPLASAFVTEIAPVKYRGSCNAALQVGYSFGDVCGMVLSLPPLMGTNTLSPYVLGFTAMTALILLIVLIYAPESPRFLILKCNKLEQGKRAIRFYQGDVKAQEVFNEILAERQIGATNKSIDGVEKKQNIFQFFANVPKKPLILACICCTVPVMSGVAIVMGYSTDALQHNRLPSSVIPYCSLTIAICNFLSSVTCMQLIERWGRRTLLLMGIIGSFIGPFMFTILSLVNVYATVPHWFGYLLVVCLNVYALFYSFFNAAGITLAAEICSQEYRSYAMAIGNFFSVLVSTVLILTYEPIKHNLGVSWVYFPFNCLATVIGFVVYRALAETTGVTLTDIKKRYVINKT